MKRLLVLSGKGGTGKTTISAALIRLANAKAVADCDVDAPNLHLVMEQTVEPQVTTFMGGDKAVVNTDLCIGCGACQENCRFDAISVMDGKSIANEFSCEGCGVCEYVCPVDAIHLVPDVAGKRELYVDDSVFSTATLKMGRGNSGKLVTEVKLAMLKSAPECDLAVTDGSPGIGCPVMASVSGMDLVLIVAEPSKSGISDLKRLVQTIATFQLQIMVCVNKYDVSPKNTDEIETFCKEENIPFVGKIPFDPEAVSAVNSGKSIVDVDCPVSDAIKEIYHTLCREWS
ncbi:ATP-binding protein [Chakrabartyella piscis]|uniref:ATP-binding protein n=1 Tax=Chakrabartyella piscis TaxID=2918914 RepID=UPI0029586E95|nr:4Fe-4S binding protein [Chakrabartyella piscis]